MLKPRLAPKGAQIQTLNSHVYRIFSVFDRLYQFGATDYFARFLGVDKGYQIFSDALSELNMQQINLGLHRVEGLENRKSVFPDARAFFRLCVMTDKEFIKDRGLYEERKTR